MKKILLVLVTTLTILFSACQGSKVVLYVSISGDDNNPGTKEQPFATLEKATKEASFFAGKKAITIYLRGGIHYIRKPILLTASTSGTKDCPIVFSSYSNEHAVISTAKPLTDLDWKEYKDGIWQAEIDESLVFDQLYLNGEKQCMARYPNYNKEVRHFNGFSKDAISQERVKRWANPSGGFVHAMHKHEWGGYQYLITGKDKSDSLILEGGFQNNRQMGMHDSYRMVENIFEELDSVNEWYYNKENKTLYFYPPKDLDLKTALIEVPQLESIFMLQGTEESPVKYIEIKNLELRQTLRTFMETKEPLLRSDWTIYRSGAIKLEGTENCLVENCFINSIGGNAIFFSNYNRNDRVENNHITNIGAGGVCFVGSPTAVRSPHFEYNEFMSWDKIDTIKGPANNNYPSLCVVDNNLIYNIGTVEKQVAGVQVSMSKNITISHNSIYDMPRSGINISEGTWGGHIIEWNDVFNTVLETGDHGSFNSWGRDRFWYADRVMMDSLNAKYPQAVLWDAVETTTIRNNRWRCDHGWDIDLDDGSSNYHIYNNLCLNGGIKLREGFHRKVENNIMVNNTFHPHVWFENSKDTFKYNIVTKAYLPIRVKDWGNEIDYNFFPDLASLKAAQENGTDNHSKAGNPMFINPAIGDYRVKDDSPALGVGFKNFDMSKFGVQNNELKKIAKIPDFPDFKISNDLANADETYDWLDAKFKNLTTEGERSATGMDGIKGVLIVKLDENSVLERFGLKENDVILKYNRADVDNWTDMEREIVKSYKGENIRITVFREQKEKIINITLP
ncbi:PDZ domain-containing protein [Dysgonomonas alginatilytica]|uniref:PDZ domain-containing protein n=1 Tax=Dysgonomonas alginatilytica TaxID=1605892 RepID=A0A2V3PUK0_9BACT|nr:PDZ domain-containing protein [Dysgonomonas alginatilytica]PXV63122.1 PDZ domain-containing protein [Dysgonomonas alginatilytica]